VYHGPGLVGGSVAVVFPNAVSLTSEPYPFRGGAPLASISRRNKRRFCDCPRVQSSDNRHRTEVKPVWDQKTASTEDLIARIRVLEEDLDSAQNQLKGKDRYIETQLKRRSHVFDVILSNLPDLICTFDLEGCFTYANPALLGV
jgi:PAS domain-containing protein